LPILAGGGSLPVLTSIDRAALKGAGTASCFGGAQCPEGLGFRAGSFWCSCGVCGPGMFFLSFRRGCGSG